MSTTFALVCKSKLFKIFQAMLKRNKLLNVMSRFKMFEYLLQERHKKKEKYIHYIYMYINSLFI